MKPLLTQAYTPSNAKIAKNITSAKPNAILKKNLQTQTQSTKTNNNRISIFSNKLELKHTFKFSQATLIKPIHSKNPGEHHTTRK